MVTTTRVWLRLLIVGLLTVIGAYFHSSGAIIGVVLLLSPKRLDRGFWLAIVLFGFWALLSGVTASSVLECIDVPAVQDRLLKYLDAMGDGLELNLNRYSPVHCFRAAFAGVCIWYWDRFAQQHQGAVVAIKAYALSIVAFWTLADIPAVAVRISQLLGVSEILLMPLVIGVWRGWVGQAMFLTLVFVNLAFYSIRLLCY